jgi:hypothetical protein
MKTINQFKEKLIPYLASLSEMPWSYVKEKPYITPWKFSNIKGHKTYSLSHGGSVTPKTLLYLDIESINARNDSGEYDRKENPKEYNDHLKKAIKALRGKKINIKEMGIRSEAYLFGNIIVENIGSSKYYVYTKGKGAVVVEETQNKMKKMKNLESLIEENDLDLEIINVDFELAVAEAAINGLASFEFEGEEYETTLTSEEAENYWGTVSEALTNAQRRKKSIAMKKGKAGRIRKKKIAEKKLSSPDKLKGKANKKARKVIEKKLLKGKDKSELSFAQRAQLEKKVEKKKGAIKRIAKRSLKDVKKADRERVKSRRSAKEDVEYTEARKLSQGFTNADKAINLLEKALRPGSNLHKGIGRDLGGTYKDEFQAMQKHFDYVSLIWKEVSTDYAKSDLFEDTELEA